MTETRYIQVYDSQGNLIATEPYEVSDEQLAEEAEMALCQEYLSHTPASITQPEIWFLLRAFGKRLGYTIG